MNWRAGSVIVAINLALVAIIYAAAALDPSMGGVMGGGMFTLVQISIMFWIAVILSIAHLVTRQAHPGLGSATKGAWLAIGLTVLVSFPVCLLVDQIQPTSFH